MCECGGSVCMVCVVCVVCVQYVCVYNVVCMCVWCVCNMYGMCGMCVYGLYVWCYVMYDLCVWSVCICGVWYVGYVYILWYCPFIPGVATREQEYPR
jgi:hypothetical protein